MNANLRKNIAIRSEKGHGLKSAKAAVLEFVLKLRDSSPTIIEDSTAVILHQVQTMTGNPGPPLARLSTLVRNQRKKSSEIKNITEVHNSDGRAMQKAPSLSSSGEAFTKIKSFFNVQSLSTDVARALISDKSFGISKLTRSASASLGLVLHDESGPGFSKAISIAPKRMKMTNKFLSAIPNPILVLSQLKDATFVGSSSFHSITFVPDPFEQPNAILPPLNLPRLHVEFNVTKDKERIKSVNISRLYLSLDESKLYMVMPSYPTDIRFQKSVIARLDEGLLGKSLELVELKYHLKRILQKGNGQLYLTPPGDMHLEVPKSFIAHAESAHKSSEYSKSATEGKTKVKYTFMSHDMRHNIDLKVQGVPATFSTTKSGILRPVETELLIHFDQPVSLDDSTSESRSVTLDKFLSSTNYLLEKSVVDLPDLSLVLKPEQGPINPDSAAIIEDRTSGSDGSNTFKQEMKNKKTDNRSRNQSKSTLEWSRDTRNGSKSSQKRSQAKKSKETVTKADKSSQKDKSIQKGKSTKKVRKSRISGKKDQSNQDVPEGKSTE
jgi:hypothetical protein